MFDYFVTVSGLEELAAGIVATVTRSADLRETKDELREEYLAQNRENLLGQGALTEGWESLKASTVRDKRRRGYGGKRIEEREGDLFRAMTTEGATGYLEAVTESEATFGTDFWLAVLQHEGKGPLSGRALIPSRPRVERYEAILAGHAAQVARLNGFA